MRLEVRCCCKPSLLLGWLSVPDFLARDGQLISFTILSDVLEYVDSSETPTPKLEDFVLEVAEFVSHKGPYLAVKDNGVKIEHLRQLQNFEERLS